MFFRTLKILGIYHRIYNIKKHWVILDKDKAILFLGPITGFCMHYVTTPVFLLELYRDVTFAIAFSPSII
jgi:hypothetical protein